MKQLINLSVALFSAAILLVSCSQKESVDVLPSEDGTKITITAEIPEMEVADETKATLSYVVRYNWNKGDRLNVINLTTGKMLGGYVSADATGNVATFSGNVKGSISETDELLFVYPYVSNLREKNFTPIQYDFRSQLGTSVESTPFVVAASASGFTSNDFTNAYLVFRYKMSFVQLNLGNIPSVQQVDRLVLGNMNGVLKLSIVGGVDSWTSSSTYQSPYGEIDASSIYLNPSGLMTLSQGASMMYFTTPIQPGLTEDRMVEMTVGGTKYVSNYNDYSFDPGTAYRHFVLNFGPENETNE